LKTCSHCKIDKDVSCFSKDKQKKDGLQIYCKSCSKIYRDKTYYKDSKLKDSIVKRNKERQLKVKEFVIDYLLKHPCIDCGEKDPVVLEFDHLNDKKVEVSRLIRDKYPLPTVQKEIEKCVVRCANCHRRKTAKDFGWYKFKDN
jgi:transcription elongation factor Elf1